MSVKQYNPEKIKIENTRQLLEQGIRVIDHLPYIEKNTHRKADEIAKRAITMAALYQLQFGAPKGYISNYLQDNNLTDQLLSQEEELLKTEYNELGDQQRVNLSWSVEAVWALTWVGNKHDNLTFNTPVEDSLASTLPNYQENEPAFKAISKFKIRPEADIHKMLDLFYRAHWFARDNHINGRKSDLVNHNIIIERRTALEWVCDDSVEWDEIELST